MNDDILKYFSLIEGLAKKYGGRHKEDCLQEGLLGGLLAIRSYQKSLGTLDKWVELNASNRIRNYLTKERRWQENNGRIREGLANRNSL
jgi:DNA-directed RNA polymerase specialized sigma24 family protein